MRASSSTGTVVPVGLAGVATRTARVRSSQCSATRSAVSCQAVSASTGTPTASPSKSRTKLRLHGYPGSVSSTRSPGSTSAARARMSAPEAPVVTTTRSQGTSTP